MANIQSFSFCSMKEKKVIQVWNNVTNLISSWNLLSPPPPHIHNSDPTCLNHRIQMLQGPDQLEGHKDRSPKESKQDTAPSVIDKVNYLCIVLLWYASGTRYEFNITERYAIYTLNSWKNVLSFWGFGNVFSFFSPPRDFISICRSTAPDVCHTSVCLTFKAFLTDCSDT